MIGLARLLLLATLLGCQAGSGLIYHTEEGNAAEAYLALRDFPTVPETILEYVASGGGPRDEIRAALGRLEGPLSGIERAARARRCEWSYPEQESIAPNPSHISGMLGACRILHARATFRMEENRVEDALQDLIVLSRMGSDFMADRVMIAQLVGIVALGFSHEVFLDSILPRDLTVDQLRRLAAHLETLSARSPSLGRSLEHDRALWGSAIDRAIEDFHKLLREVEGNPRAKEEEPNEQFKMIQKILKADREASRSLLRRRLDECWDRLIGETERPVHGTAGRLKLDELKRSATRKLAEYQVLENQDRGLDGAADTFLCLAVPPVDRLKDRHAAGRLFPMLHALWCRIELYRHERGAYPASLEEAGIGTADPYDGKSLKYERFDGKGRTAFVLTAAGPKDDWKARIRALAEAGFDRARYEASRADDLESSVWASRPR